MVTCSSNNFRSGLKIIVNNEPYEVESSEFINLGRGQAFSRVKLRCLLNGTKIEKTFKSSHHVIKANIINLELVYLYSDKSFFYFINNKNYEQLVVNTEIIGNHKKWMIYREKYTVTLWNEKVISILPPTFIELKVIETSPYLRGNTICNSGKYATLSTGVIVKVPLFIQSGEIIKVDTRSCEYVSRTK